MRRLTGTFFLTTLLFAASCGGREEHTITTHAELDVTRDDAPADRLLLEARLPDSQVDERTFADLWDAVARGRQPAEAVAVTLAGGSDREVDGARLLGGMVLYLPTPLREGRTYPLTSTRPPPVGSPDMPMYWATWGAHALREEGEAEIALRLFDYYAVGMRKENEFVATAVTGTVTIDERYDELLEMSLDITATDANGQQVRLAGGMRLAGERFTPPF